MAEVKTIVQDLEKEQENVHTLHKIIVGVILLSICGFAAMFGVTMAANEMSKDTHPDPDGTMKDNEGHTVQVASSDMDLADDGTLVPRHGEGAIRTAVHTTPHA